MYISSNEVDIILLVGQFKTIWLNYRVSIGGEGVKSRPAWERVGMEGRT
jgi:hypothetical protein